jgi:hypothetical protein
MENLKKIILIFFFVVPFIGSSQISFYNKFTSGPFDQGNGIDQLPDSSYAITGSSGGFDLNSGQAFLMLVDSLGDHLWTRDYGGAGDDIGVRVIHIPGDGFFIAGYTGSTSAGDFDFVVYKTDEAGILVWEKHYGGSNWEILHDARLLADGGLVLVGQTEGPTTNGADMFFVRTDALGDTIWTKTIETPQDDVAYAVDTLSSTQIVIGGDMGDAGVVKGMITGYHIDGSQEWLEYYDQNGSTKVRDIEVYDNNIYLVGSMYDDVLNQENMWFAKGDMTGNYLLDNTGSYDGDSRNTAFTIRDDLGVYLGLSSDAPVLSPFSGGNDIFVLRFGTFMSYNNESKGFSGVDEDIINHMIVANDGGIVFVGTVSDNEAATSSGTDVLVARMGPADETTPTADTGLDFVGLYQEEKSILAVHPNPTRNMINFPDKVNGLNYQVINFQGKIVMDGKINSFISLMELTPGIYMIKVEGENQIWTSKVIKE